MAEHPSGDQIHTTQHTQSDNPDTHSTHIQKHKLTTCVNMHPMHEIQTNNKQFRDTMSWWKVPPVSSSGGGGRLNDVVAAVELIEPWSFC